MINQVYRLIAPRQFSIEFSDISLLSKNVIVRPQYLSICAADQRYFQGMRDRLTLDAKLPMALIHEAWGTVVHDGSGSFDRGSKVLLIPNTPCEKDSVIRENYLASSRFRASGFDGFMQEYVEMSPDRVIPFDGIKDDVAALSEIMSVAMHSVSTMMELSHSRRDVIGVWGDGNVGYLVALSIKLLMPKSKLVVFGRMKQKLSFFSFADSVYDVNDITGSDTIPVDHAFECVGGGGSEYAIDQAIDFINPEGTITLMGVSENNVPIRTRMILEKGLRLIGRSRSGREDFIKVAGCLADRELQSLVSKIIREVVTVRDISDVAAAFEEDSHQPFKTVMKWEI